MNALGKDVLKFAATPEIVIVFWGCDPKSLRTPDVEAVIQSASGNAGIGTSHSYPLSTQISSDNFIYLYQWFPNLRPLIITVFVAFVSCKNVIIMDLVVELE